MKNLVMVVVAVVILGLVVFLVYENAGKKHHAELLPGAQGQEGGRGEIVEFRTIRYEPNTGQAKAYAVVKVLNGKKTYKLGRSYAYSSPTGEEKWTVKSRSTVWDESKGDSIPFITPYWAIK